MTLEQEGRLSAFLDSLRDVPWFGAAGSPTTRYRLVADAVAGWDDWSPQMAAVWPRQSEPLEAAARRAIGDDAIETIFNRVAAAIEPAVGAGVRAYFARRPNTTVNTDCEADSALRPDIIGFVLRDVSWAAVETVLDRPSFFVSVVHVQREGRWPCSWDGRYPKGRFVVL